MQRRHPEIAKFKRLLLLQDRYICILVDEMSEMIEEGHISGWVSKRAGEIAQLRGEIRTEKKMTRQLGIGRGLPPSHLSISTAK